VLISGGQKETGRFADFSGFVGLLRDWQVSSWQFQVSSEDQELNSFPLDLALRRLIYNWLRHSLVPQIDERGQKTRINSTGASGGSREAIYVDFIN